MVRYLVVGYSFIFTIWQAMALAFATGSTRHDTSMSKCSIIAMGGCNEPTTVVSVSCVNFHVS